MCHCRLMLRTCMLRATRRYLNQRTSRWLPRPRAWPLMLRAWRRKQRHRTCRLVHSHTQEQWHGRCNNFKTCMAVVTLDCCNANTSGSTTLDLQKVFVPVALASIHCAVPNVHCISMMYIVKSLHVACYVSSVVLSLTSSVHNGVCLDTHAKNDNASCFRRKRMCTPTLKLKHRLRRSTWLLKRRPMPRHKRRLMRTLPTSSLLPHLVWLAK